ncbi:TRMT1-like protein isoform X1 [Polypterus senegalus]|uniref:TRMT1-like protein isoform X1 n=2 Tax=Polypterus senegalus TaxID=55291 RepID=UPI001962FC89|nr:TRMT1-like protein isoform X1 [Polypterus senegalus]
MAEQQEEKTVRVSQEDAKENIKTEGNGVKSEPIMVEVTKEEDCNNVSDVSESSLKKSAASTNIKERHFSIQAKLSDLKNLIDVNESGKMSCPLCPEDKFKVCYINKLHRHLQNLHWKVSVEFEGHRMCICHLPCRQQKQNLTEDQASNRLGIAHYHCIVCSATIARRTDMISHIKRHVNKGDTKASYTGGSGLPLDTDEVSVEQTRVKVIEESNTNVKVLPNSGTPLKTDTFFNGKMKANRQLVFCALAALTEERAPLECLDAFGATGIMGLQWAQHLLEKVKVTINDINEASVKVICENCHLNQIAVNVGYNATQDDSRGEDFRKPLTTVEVTKTDANVLLHMRAFDFVHLDPYGTAVNFLDAAFRNVRNLGIVSVTSTDISSLYTKAPNVTLRHYGCVLVRTEYYKELAARMVVAAIARAAARCNKGIEVLLAVALEHFVLVVVRVLRGSTQADESVKKIRRLLHCQWCEERVFLKDGSMVEDLYRQLPCDCNRSMPGKTAVELGPLWSGSLFNIGFLRRMMAKAAQHGITEIQQVLKALVCEAECTILKTVSTPGSGSQSCSESGLAIVPSQKPDDVVNSDASSQQGKRKTTEASGTAVKRQKFEASLEHPSFYYSIHRHSIRGMNMPKLNKFLQYLTEAGFRVSRTHFDPTGIRTDATLGQFKSVLAEYTKSQTGNHTFTSDDGIDIEFV